MKWYYETQYEPTNVVIFFSERVSSCLAFNNTFLSHSYSWNFYNAKSISNRKLMLTNKFNMSLFLFHFHRLFSLRYLSHFFATNFPKKNFFKVGRYFHPLWQHAWFYLTYALKFYLEKLRKMVWFCYFQ